MNEGGAQRSRFADGRWHFQHGPIDLVIGLDTDAASAASADDLKVVAIEAAWRRFTTILPELVAELPQLRADGMRPKQLKSVIGQTMAAAVWPYHERHGLYVTPMAAVAGSVAQHVLDCLVRPGISRAYVNNGGDIALHLSTGTIYRAGVVSELPPRHGSSLPAMAAALEVSADSGLRGIATSGWRGRSLSLGIADAVTVLAASAAEADAAATLIANAVNADDPAIVRLPAHAVRDDSDLQDRLVTRAVPRLPIATVDEALARGAEFADLLESEGMIGAAYLCLQGRHRTVGGMTALSRKVTAARLEQSDRQPEESSTWQPISANCR